MTPSLLDESVRGLKVSSIIGYEGQHNQNVFVRKLAKVNKCSQSRASGPGCFGYFQLPIPGPDPKWTPLVGLCLLSRQAQLCIRHVPDFHVAVRGVT